MRKATKIFAVIMVLALVLAAFAGCDKGPVTTNTTPGTSATTAAPTATPTPKEPLHLVIFGYSLPNPTSAPQDKSLWNYIFQKQNEYVGREVTAEWTGRTVKDQSYTQYLQLQAAANQYPDIIWAGDLFWLAADFKYIRDNPKTRELSLDLIEQNMPGFVARINQYGLDFEGKFMPANIDVETNKYWYVPYSPPVSAMSNLPANFTPIKGGDPFYVWKDSSNYYGLCFRDDVLTKIKADTKTEKQLIEVFKSKGGMLDPSDVTADMPIDGSLASIAGYMQKVKDLNLKAGNGQPIQPGAPNSSSESVGSLSWSMATMTGLHYRWPVRIGNPDPSKSYFVSTSENYKSVMRWYNDLYNKGLIDPEMFVMKDDALKAKIVNGEYAMFNYWLYTDAVRQQATKEGYGHRYWPIGLGIMDMENNNNKYWAVTNKTSATLWFTTELSDEDLPDAMKYMDFMLTEQSDELCFWGLPEWTTGEGADRKYKDEYKGISDWVLYGTTSDKDGRYYGLAASTAIATSIDTTQHEIKAIAFFNPQYTYPGGPAYTITKDMNVVLANLNINAECDRTMNLKYLRPHESFYMETANFRYSDLTMLPEFTDYDTKSTEKATEDGAIRAKIATCKPAEFDTNWDAYIALQTDCGIFKAADAISKKIGASWQTEVIARVIPHP